MSRERIALDGDDQEPAVDRRTFIGRGVVAAAGMTAAGAALSACGSSGGAATGKSAKSVNVVAPQDPALDPVKKFLLPQFTKETGVRIQYLETDWGSIEQKLVRDAQNNTGIYDFEIGILPPQMAGPGLLHNLDDLGVKLDDDIFPSIKEQLYFPVAGSPVPPIAKGKQPALIAGCIIADVTSFVYRTDHFEKPPVTWNDVIATVDKQADPAKKLYSYVFPGSRANGDPVNWWLPLLFSYGGGILNSKWEPIFNQQPGVEGLNTLFALQRKAPPGVAQFGYDQVSQAVNGGQALTATLWGGWVKDAFDPKKSKVADKVAAIASPIGTKAGTALGPFYVGIPRSARNPEGAATLMNWLMSKRIQRQYAEQYGGISVRRSVLDDPSLQAKYAYFKAWSDSLKVAESFPPTDQVAGVVDAMGIQLNKAYTEQGSAGAKSYLDAAASAVHDVLSRAGYYSG